MRLIDADAFKKYIRDACNEMSHVYKDGGKWAKQITEDFCMDIDEQPTIEERKTGKWVGIKEYCDHLNEKAEREGKGNRYMPSGMNIRVYCNQCWEPNDRRTTYCPNCSARMGQEEGPMKGAKHENESVHKI